MNHECKFSGDCLNSGFHGIKIPVLLFIVSPFWRLLCIALIHLSFSGFLGCCLQVNLYVHPNNNSTDDFDGEDDDDGNKPPLLVCMHAPTFLENSNTC